MDPFLWAKKKTNIPLTVLDEVCRPRFFAIILDMYRVIIADDEEATRSRLKTLFSSLAIRNLGFELVGSFENGYDALEGGVSLDPDLLVTDIKMPFIEGLSLIRQMRQSLPLLQSIILSGFDNFDYAKKAIELDVASYLSKPIDEDELLSALKRVKERLERLYQVSPEGYGASKKDRQSLLKSEQNADLLRLITLKNVGERFSGKLLLDGIDLREGYVVLGIFDPDKEEDALSYEELEVAQYQLQEQLMDGFKEKGISLYVFDLSPSLGVLYVSPKPFKKSDLEHPVFEIITKIKKSLGFSFSAAFSEDKAVLEKGLSYRRLYRHAKWSLEYRTVVGNGVVLFYSDFSSQNPAIGKVDDNDFRAISYALLYGKKEEAKKLIDQMLETISSVSYKDSYFLIVNNLLDAILKSSIDLQRFYQSYRPHVALVNDLIAIKGKEGMKAFFFELVERLLKVNAEVRSSGVEDAYDRMVAYIESHFRENVLSVEDLSQELGYSSSYIFTIFRRHGTSFTKLLTSFRMAEAKKLLANPDNRMSQIAHEIGYDDPYYFSHCFKRFYGVSPQEYRKG